MKKMYEKPVVYSEKLAIDSLRAQTCQELDEIEPSALPMGHDFCGDSDCTIFANSPSF